LKPQIAVSVPERGLEAFAVGIDKQRTEIHRQLKLASDGEGVFKFLRGGYGCGKTLELLHKFFMLQ